MRDPGFLFVSANYSVEGINPAIGAPSVKSDERSLCRVGPGTDAPRREATHDEDQRYGATPVDDSSDFP